MRILELSARAQNYYESTRSKTLHSGYERNILVREDFENAVFVDSKYQVQPGDIIFRCKTINGNTVIELKESIADINIEKIALAGKFTEDDWRRMLDKMNGIMHTTEIDPRDEIAGEVENEELENKIKGLSKTEGYILLKEIQRFWNNLLDFNDFIKPYVD